MRIKLFNLVNDLLTAIKKSDGKSVIRHVGIWDNQTQLPMEEQPFLLPAVFVEFGDIQYDTLSGGGQHADMSFTLHVVTDARKSSELQSMQQNTDLCSLICAKLSRSGSADIGSIRRTASVTDSDFDEWIENQEQYVCGIIDTTAQKSWSQAEIDAISITFNDWSDKILHR